MPFAEVNKYLSLLSSVNSVNDTVFKKFNLRYSGERYSCLALSFDMKQPWMKKLFQTKGKTGNKGFDDIMTKYKFKCKKVSDVFHIAEFYSDEILNIGPLIDQLKKIKGVQLPILKEIYEPILKELENYDINFKERKLDKAVLYD